MKHVLTIVLAALVMTTVGVTTMQPARADQAAKTRNLILGAAALVTGFAVESNVARKHRLANTIEGYLPDGSTVYADGRVVLPNGQSYYPGNYGQTIACSAGSCYINNGNQAYNGYGGYGAGGNPYYNYPYASGRVRQH